MKEEIKRNDHSKGVVIEIPIIINFQNSDNSNEAKQ